MYTSLIPSRNSVEFSTTNRDSFNSSNLIRVRVHIDKKAQMSDMRKARKAYEEIHASREKSLHVKPQPLNAYRVRLLRSKLDEEINDLYDEENRNRSMEK